MGMERAPKHQTSVTLTQEAKRLVEMIAAKLGISRSAVWEIAIRRMARDEGVR